MYICVCLTLSKLNFKTKSTDGKNDKMLEPLTEKKKVPLDSATSVLEVQAVVPPKLHTTKAKA